MPGLQGAPASGASAGPDSTLRIDPPSGFGALDAGARAMLRDEPAIGLGLAPGMEVGRLVAGGPAAHGAGPPATSRAGDGENRMSPGGEVDHHGASLARLAGPLAARPSIGQGDWPAGFSAGPVRPQSISGGSHAATRARCSAGISISGWNRASSRAHFSPFLALAKARASALSASISRSSHQRASR